MTASSSSSLPSVVVFGSTGLVGSYLLTALIGLSGTTFGTIHTITRRAPKQAGDEAAKTTLDTIVEPDTAAWTAKLKGLAAATTTGGVPETVFSSLGTTRAQAGGIANQWKIDHDLNVEIAQAAKAGGARTFVFVSSAGVRSLVSRRFPYSRMKIGVEDTIRDLAFDQAIILHPALIMGDREVPHTGAPLMMSAVRGLGRFVSRGLQDTLGQEAEVIGRAAARAAQLAAQGKAPSKYWELEPADIVRLGRDEWASAE